MKGGAQTEGETVGAPRVLRDANYIRIQVAGRNHLDPETWERYKYVSLYKLGGVAPPSGPGPPGPPPGAPPGPGPEPGVG
jgi:hypothetical protein